MFCNQFFAFQDQKALKTTILISFPQKCYLSPTIYQKSLKLPTLYPSPYFELWSRSPSGIIWVYGNMIAVYATQASGIISMEKLMLGPRKCWLLVKCWYSVVFGNRRQIFGQNGIFRTGNGAEFSVSSKVENSGFGWSLLYNEAKHKFRNNYAT
jgi:hypothetical protein